ncbi:CdaR family protein [Parasphaerochaeta coccoides]|uniref:YbbR family protein n=1 Tax=Parasphaerochaeta coccoides (strain ATCC BAA-1237 / DSM 17374 / SPN1) TaxID=760011 RepID=F4GI60_PARC1|nr:CdaR family protein [Parasphaerochaeta coccoides]AEC02658.1 YbbR family protein [Parasphaerochaeta coccoides DSM 17374]
MKLNKIFQNLAYNWPVKLLCLICALGVYVIVQYSLLSNYVIDIPLNYTAPEGYVAASLIPDTIEVSITGPDEDIYRIIPERITASVDFSFVSGGGPATTLVNVDYQSVLKEMPGVSITTHPASVTVDFKSLPSIGQEPR